MLTSLGIFDSHNFQPCSRFNTEAACISDIFRSTISKICQCTIFSDAVSSRHLDNRSFDQRELCTVKKYEKCWDEAKRKFEKLQAEAKSAQSCKPCVLYKNSSSIQKPVEVFGLDPPRFTVQFRCNDLKYLYFEDRVQYSFSQLILQIGGDLGLYNGFSMINILELTLFIYHAYQQWKQFQSNQISPSAASMLQTPANGLVQDWNGLHN